MLIHCFMYLTLFVGVSCCCFLFSYPFLCVLSRFIIILMGKKELVALFLLPSLCHGVVSVPE